MASNKKSKTTSTVPNEFDGDLLKYIHKKSPTSIKIQTPIQAIPDSNTLGSKQRWKNLPMFTSKHRISKNIPRETLIPRMKKFDVV